MVRKTVLAMALMALVGVGAMGCHGSTPTSSSGFQLLITANLANTALAPTITEAQVLIDGVVVADTPESPAGAIAALSGQVGGVPSGNNTMQVLIVSQTSSPNSYTVTAPVIQVFDANGNPLRTIQLSPQTASLATGGSISFSFTL